MARTEEIKIRLSAEGKAAVISALRELGREGQKAAKSIEDGAKPASTALVAINAAAKEGSGAIEGYARRLGPLGAGLKAIGPAGLVAAAAVAGFTVALTAAIRRAEEAGARFDELADTADNLGLTAEALQELRFTADQNGASAERLQIAWALFAKNVGDATQGTGRAKQVFDDYNISLRNADGTARGAIDIFRDLADVMKETTSETERQRIAQKVFGEAGKEMVSVLRLGRDGLEEWRRKAREVGAVLDEDLVRRAGDTNRELRQMREIIKVQLDAAFVGLLPLALDAAKGFASLARAVRDVSDAFRELEQRSSEGLESQLSRVNGQIADTFEAINAARARSAFTGRAGAEARNEVDRLEDRLKELRTEADRIQAELERRAQARRDAETRGGAVPTPDDPTLRAAQARAEEQIIEARRKAFLRTLTDRDAALAEATFKLGPQATKEQVEEIRRLTAAQYDAEQSEKRLQEALRDTARLRKKDVELMTDSQVAAKEAGTVIGDQFRGIRLSALTGTQAVNSFADALTAFADRLAQLLIFDPLANFAQKGLTNLIGNLLGTGTFGGGFGGAGPATGVDFTGGGSLFAAHGAAFSAGQVVPFARGGVLDRPTVRPIALMAERGPEAVVPLTRLPSGDLGVRAAGGGGLTIDLRINGRPAERGEAEVRGGAGGSQVTVFVDEIERRLAGRVSRGQGPLTTAISRRFGADVAAGL